MINVAEAKAGYVEVLFAGGLYRPGHFSTDATHFADYHQDDARR